MYCIWIKKWLLGSDRTQRGTSKKIILICLLWFLLLRLICTVCVCVSNDLINWFQCQMLRFLHLEMSISVVIIMSIISWSEKKSSQFCSHQVAPAEGALCSHADRGESSYMKPTLLSCDHVVRKHWAKSRGRSRAAGTEKGPPEFCSHPDLEDLSKTRSSWGQSC